MAPGSRIPTTEASALAGFSAVVFEVSLCPLPPPGSLEVLQEASHGALQSKEGRQGPHQHSEDRVAWNKREKEHISYLEK